jgi:hypothetical protein
MPSCIPFFPSVLIWNAASFSNVTVFEGENILNTMKTQTEIPVLTKSKIAVEKKQEQTASSCCTPKNDATVCCTPSEKLEDNGGACCAQPEDGSSCCDK